MTKLVWPVDDGPGQLNQGFIPGVNNGLDIGWYNADPTNSKRTYFAAPGVVVKVEDYAGYNGGWGNRIWVEHAPGVITAYNHYWDGVTSQFAVGQQVSAGQYIGQMGSTGNSTGEHLHFELWLNGSRVDPTPYFTQDLPGTRTLLKPNQRTTAGWPVAARTMADLTTEPFVALLSPGTVIDCIWWQYGQGAGGNNVFFLAAFPDGRQFYVHSGDIIQSGVDGIPEYEGQKPKPPVVVPPVDPPVVVPPINPPVVVDPPVTPPVEPPVVPPIKPPVTPPISTKTPGWVALLIGAVVAVGGFIAWLIGGTPS